MHYVPKFPIAYSEAVAPNELLWNDILWNLPQSIEVWSLLEVDIHAVSEADFLFAEKGGGLNSEWIWDPSTTLLHAGKGGLSGLLTESHGEEGLLYLSLLGFDILN